MGKYDPWGDLSQRTYLSVEFIDMPTGRRGCIRGNVILIDQHQLQVERRCTVAHELVHDERRVFPAVPALRAREEALVERTAARRLIALPDLVDALRACSSRHAHDLADHLWVDLPMLEARMNALDPVEIAELEHHLEDQWLWIP
ncbi:ImmA/IrrE family metallo-endopeptidase [Mycolicibacterium litorale]|uniref:ImmA/IrrE family metallo-endopeptidase n=1 Tax=Mycolicibacterium litorale TaxID=758802 RepID=UPI003CF7A722